MTVVSGTQTYGRLQYWMEETPTFRTRVVRGFLDPTLAGPRVKSQTVAVSQGTGDDAGHLIARRFGGPDTPWNLGRQNWLQNRGKGTYYAAETRWADALHEGSEVYVTVSERTRLTQDGTFEDRALYREVSWKISTKQGQIEEGHLSFLNSDSAKVREALGVTPAMTYSDNVYSIFSGRKL